MADIATVDQLDARGKQRARPRRLQRARGHRRRRDPTIPASARRCPPSNKLVDDGARVILMSHLGRPAGEGFEEKFTLAPGRPAPSAGAARPRHRCVSLPSTVGPDAQAKAAAPSGRSRCSLLENLRFDKREKKNDPEFCQEPRPSSAKHTSNDAFGTAHRAHASTAGVAALPARLCRLPHGSARWPRSPACSTSPAVPSSPSLAARRSPTRSRSSTRCMDKCRHPHHRRRHVLHVPGWRRASQVGTSLKEEDWVERAGGHAEARPRSAA